MALFIGLTNRFDGPVPVVGVNMDQVTFHLDRRSHTELKFAGSPSLLVKEAWAEIEAKMIAERVRQKELVAAMGKLRPELRPLPYRPAPRGGVSHRSPALGISRAAKSIV
jgi:hypothetical protein